MLLSEVKKKEQILETQRVKKESSRFHVADVASLGEIKHSLSNTKPDLRVTTRLSYLFRFVSYQTAFIRVMASNVHAPRLISREGSSLPYR
jgi:hypothetical protein